jgi:uridine kinase
MTAPNQALDELVARTLGARNQRATTVVAIDGPAGAGKSTLAGRLEAALSRAGVPTAVVRMDDLYPGWDGLDDGVPHLLRWVLEPLSRNQAPRYHRYDWPTGRFAEWKTVPTTQVLIVEGVGSGSSAAAPYLDMLIWIEAPRTVRFDRGLERDGEAYRPMWERWALQEELMFAREHTRDRADVILDGTSAIH